MSRMTNCTNKGATLLIDYPCDLSLVPSEIYEQSELQSGSFKIGEDLGLEDAIEFGTALNSRMI
jgi:hypothetical protein